jgi:dihydroorotase
MTATSFTLPLWADLHAHFRQGSLLNALAADHLSMGCYAVLAMPNTQPPVACVQAADEDEGRWSVERYTRMLDEACGGKAHIIAPLYITQRTNAEMIEQGAKSGLLKAAKYYPPHGTTNSSHGIPMDDLIGNDVLKAMEETGTILCIHGEEHELSGADYFDKHSNAESWFYMERLPRIVDAHPRLRIVAEHITTRAAVDFVKQADPHVVATITPQHLLYTVGHLLQGWLSHLRCMPLLKFETDRRALREAVTAADNTRFFAGTDSAPHPRHSKALECGCAAGCYVGGIAPQLYAMAFEEAGCDLSTQAGQQIFQRFLCDIGPKFYGLPKPGSSFRLVRETSVVTALEVEGVGSIARLPVGLSKAALEAGQATLPWRLELL